MDDLTLRVASPDDLDRIVRVFLECWRQSYVGVLPSSVIDEMTDGRADALWQRVLASHEGEVVVAEDGRELLGLTRYARIGNKGAVHSLYVAPGVHGQGVGGRLLGHAETRLHAQGASVVRLWVFAANAGSLGFYRAHGWQPDGEQRVEDEFGEPELRLTKALG
ncbi:GNAT family N-acetyltransferase [Propionimicrobium sp. PCR01-08-3]|uniref:GNAT family N-acetyltransferase n=1 Tax=Propionimicrobium sp. PCR01-08-3 TaxID=3052086 RepID=UPI00255CB738|nr:GNAT family N-acetyltransferase [Propionimicrobium sp. PCR01-08-3]WIY82445.1 GNAT family N-acetyltransferase [Propionimicrobium sp. PCR01-08-3]